MTPDDRPLDALCDSVAGGEPVDWAAHEARSGSDLERSQLRALRDLEKVAAFHRGLQREVGSGDGDHELTRWGGLLVLERVGVGAGGDVHRAWDPALQREVALKILRPRDGASSADLLEEARALARVRDPHVVAVHGAGEHDGRVGLWMEFLEGPTLEEEIARRGPFPPNEVARLGAQIGGALAAVHAAGALHRDVKPSNVILARDGRAVLMDFGLGHRRGTGRTDPGPFSGTPMFMSPQRLAGAPATASDDLYALGATLRCALTGAPPFAARTLDELRVAAASGPPERLRSVVRGIPPDIADAVERAMAPAPQARFASARELADAFERARTRTTDAAPPRASRMPWLVAVAGALVIAAFIVLSRAPRTKDATPAPAGSPAPPASAASPTTIAAGAYDVSATFVRRGGAGDTRLGSGDRVGPGDRLSLEFRATRPVWVYVLDSDERGETYLLYPQPIFDRANPIPGDSTIVLPGTRGGKESAWTVTSRGGREHLLVVASPARVPDLENDLARLPAAEPGRPIHYARVETGTVERLRGIGGVSETVAPKTIGRASDLFERIRALAGSEQGVRGVWMRQVTLENPLK